MANNLDPWFRNGAIELDEIRAVYYSGQTVNGSVIFDLKQPLDFNALYIQYHGQAKVFWTETESETIHGNEQERMVAYRSNEEYLNYTETLAGGSGITQLPPKYYSFPFKFQIPFNAPSSFEGEKGSVLYTITATMVNADMSKEELEKQFTVVAPLDLNTADPRVKTPIDLEFEEMYGCSCFCSSDPVTIRVQLPVTGYCPGQAIPVTIDIKNDSSVEITKMIFEILKREAYRSSQPPSEFILPEKVLVTAKKGAVMGHSKRQFTCNIVLPDMIAPYLENCSVINVGYFFRITIKLSGCNDELQDEAEICLGLVPIKETLQEEYKHPMSHSLPTGPIPINNSPMGLTVPPVVSPGFGGSTNSLNRSQTNLTQNYANPNCLPPYPGNYAPYPLDNRAQQFTGSNQNLNRSQTNISHNAPQIDCPPPYPGYVPYPTQNTTQIPVPGQASYEIGFKASGRSSPCNVGYPGVPNTAYPSNNLTPGYPYPTSMSPAQSGYIPSAPPAAD